MTNEKNQLFSPIPFSIATQCLKKKICSYNGFFFNNKEAKTFCDLNQNRSTNPENICDYERSQFDKDFYFIKNDKLFYSVRNDVYGNLRCHFNNSEIVRHIKITGKNNFTFHKNCSFLTKHGIISHIQKPFYEINLKSFQIQNFIWNKTFLNLSDAFLNDTLFKTEFSILLDSFENYWEKFQLNYFGILIILMVAICFMHYLCRKVRTNL